MLVVLIYQNAKAGALDSRNGADVVSSIAN